MSKGDPNDPIDLSPAGAKGYAERIAAAKQGQTPVGGAPMPSIPRLDQPPPGAPRDRALGVQQAQNQQAAAQGVTRAMTPEQYQQATQSGQAIAGVGGAYMANQPKGTQIQPPQTAGRGTEMERTGADGQMANPIRPEGGLSPQTLEQLNAVAEANKEEPKEEKKEEADFDEFDFEEFGRASKDILSNKERREAIEAKITEEMDFEGLIINQELRQTVPIRKGFEPTFRTPGGHEDLFVKRLIGKIEGSERYVLDYFAVMGLVCGLYALNGRPLPTHLDNNGDPDEKLFEAKMKTILKYPLVIVTDLSANFTWFSTRVQKLLALDKVKDF